jgi:hypothetical protein
MPLILAIEPDRRQAVQLTGIIRNRIGAELVLATTTEGALEAIGSLVPDLVLVPALLSPHDDAALAAALRVIAAAAHVRTLTTPVLASTTKRTSRGGVLAKWRRSRAESPAPDGCEPAVFAEQIAAYLKEATAERAELEVSLDRSAEYDVPADREAAFDPSAEYDVPAGDVSAPTEQLQGAAPPLEAPAYEELAPAIEAVAIDPAPPEPIEVEAALGAPIANDVLVVFEPVLVEQPSVPALVYEEEAPALEAAADVTASSEDVIDLSDQLLDVSPDAALKTFFSDEPAEAYAVASAPEEITIEVFDLLPTLLEEPEACAPVVAAANEPVVEFVDQSAAAVAVEPDVAPERPKIELWMPQSMGANRSWPRLEGIRAEAAPLVLEPEEAPASAQPERDLVAWQPEPAPAIAAQPEAGPADGLSERREWVELVASLRLDIERLRAERLQPPPPPPGTERDERVVRKPKRRPKKPKPIQDEWGFFDPEQCGFAALLAKLDEITDGGDEPEARPPA